jgi:hypothetical protein
MDDMELAAADSTIFAATAVAAFANDLFAKDGSGSSRTQTRSGAAPGGGRLCRARTRRSIREIYEQLGPVYFQRAHRMKFSTFKCLAIKLHPYIYEQQDRKEVIDHDVF